MDIIIKTPRLTLVPISEKYAPDIFKEFTADVTTYMLSKPPETIADSIHFIHTSLTQMAQGKELQFVILHTKTEEYLGGCGINHIDTKTPELGIWIKKSAHGNKYGQEAVKGLAEWAKANLDYDYLIYPVDKRNIPSRKIAQSLGGVVKKEYKKTNQSGNILDEVEYWIYKDGTTYAL